MVAAIDFAPESGPDLGTCTEPCCHPGAARHGERPVARVVTLFAPVERRPLQLTRRGRRALATVVLALAAALLWMAARSGPSAVAAVPVPATVTVQSGDTLWSIATRIAPGSDPRAEVDALQAANHLRSPHLVPGQVLRTR